MGRIESISYAAKKKNTLVYDTISVAIGEDGWEREIKQTNFNELCRIEDMAIRPLSGGYYGLKTGADILDVGCGTGDFYPYLKKRGIHSYTGLDIYPPALKRAREKYPDINILSADILAGDFFDTFDYVFASGALSVRQPNTDNYDFLGSMVGAMWSMTRHGLAFNILTDNTPSRANDPWLFAYNVERVMDICQKVAPDAEIAVRPTPIINRKIPQVQERDWVGQAHIYLYHNISTRTPLFPIESS